MARKIEYHLVDDLDGGTATETVAYGLDGTTYEIDLSTENAKTLRDALAPFVANSRKVARRTRGARKPAGDTTAIREWARSQGMKVSDRGRIPADVVAAYEAAQREPAKPKRSRARKPAELAEPAESALSEGDAED